MQANTIPDRESKSTTIMLFFLYMSIPFLSENEEYVTEEEYREQEEQGDDDEYADADELDEEEYNDEPYEE